MGKEDTIVIVAPGPSLTQDQVDLCKDHFMITIGNAWRMNAQANILYHCDKRWWDYYQGVPSFLGKKISIDETRFTQSLQLSEKRTGLDLRQGWVVGGKNSGYQAINLAVHYQPKKIILLGYDMKLGKNGEKNIDGNHPREVQKDPSDFNLFKKHFETMLYDLELLKISVYNCSTDSDLDCFEKKALKDALRTES